MESVAYVVWSIGGALLCGVVALALNRWARSWELRTRVGIATLVSLFPAMAIVVIVVAPGRGQVLLSMSPDEFLLPFAFQILMVLALSVPVAWLVSRRSPKSQIQTDVFK